MIKLIILINGLILISKVEELGVDIGEPDCKLIEPFVLNRDQTLAPWLVDETLQNVFKISSDKILTITDPKPTLIEKYQQLVK